jgi:A/G-specific adenine glycosylase
LQQWYQSHGRHGLPWRLTPDPYRIYLSEVMLQQTQVATVLARFYHPFLERFPTLASLAAASQEEVLHQWQGLGYYRRAVYLHAAAKIVAPTLPNTVEALLALPGIGRNTAHAILAFGYHLPYPVMEANVRRLLHRLFALTAASDRVLWEHAWQLLDHQLPYRYNQAMMDVGALVCKPVTPDCAVCPLATICQGKAEPALYPAPKRSQAIPTRYVHITVLQHPDGRVAMQARPGPFLQGLYRFVEEQTVIARPEAAAIQPPTSVGEVYVPGSPRRGLRLARDDDSVFIGHLSHTYSHFHLEASIGRKISEQLPAGFTWVHWQEIGKLPVSGVEKKTLTLFANRAI